MNRLALSRVLLLSLAATLTSACPRRNVDSLDNPKGLLPIQVTIQAQQTPGSWGIVYQFPQPALEAIFEREGYPYRDRWRVISPAEARLLVEDGATRITTPNKSETFETAVLQIDEEDLPPFWDVPLFIRYADGSRLVYTGHLNLIPCGVDGCSGQIELTQKLKIPQVFQFVPRSGERAIVGGKIIRDAGWWKSSGTGTYAYFGKTEPLVREHFIGVIDAGLPPWLRERTETLLPLLFDVYRERTGKALREPPVVFLSFGDRRKVAGITMRGSTLPGTLQLRISLNESLRANRSAEVEDQLFHFAAHQAGHLWMGQLYRPEKATDAWLEESATEGFALRALRQLELIDAAMAQKDLSLAVSKCAAESAGPASPLRPHQTDGCGSALALFSEAATRQKQPTEDLFSVWRKVFERTANGHYTSDIYFSVLGEMAGPDAERRGRALATPGTRTPDLLITSLQEAGITATRGAEPPQEFRRYAGELAVRRLMHHACGPALPGTTAASTPSCERIWEPSDVIEIAGRPLSDGLNAYAEVARLCAANSSVQLTVPESTQGPISLPCSAPLPPPPEYLQVAYELPVPAKAPNGAPK